jgi:aspartate racemase
VSASPREQVRDIVTDLVADGADGIILGCTEIELLVRPEDSPVPLLAPPPCTRPPRWTPALS